MSRYTISFAILAASLLLASTAKAQEGACFESSAWPEADALFRQDPNWVGADDAYSVDLGNERTLWLFADTWIDTSGEQTREGARLIRNSVAIQTGQDPVNADITFYWSSSRRQGPQDFFAARDDQWFWPGHGVLIEDRLIIFLNRVRSSPGGLGFESDGWDAVLIDNPDDEPPDWNVRLLDTPVNPLGVTAGFAGVLVQNGYLHAFGSASPVKSHPIYALRWPVERAARGRLENPEWWGGADYGWIDEAADAARWPVFENGQSELTIHFEPALDRYMAVHSVGFGSTDIAARYAGELTGPWSQPMQLYRPPEYGQADIMIYAAKAHPQLEGAELVLTYVTNSFEFQDHFTNPDLYYPRFVRLEYCR